MQAALLAAAIGQALTASLTGELGYSNVWL
jgi:hypothetical protein